MKSLWNNISLILCMAMLLSGCAGIKPGEVFSEQRRLATVDELVSVLEKNDYLILGEFHDNPEQHELQLEILKRLHQRGWLKQLSLEMLVSSQQSAADEAVKQRISDPDQLYQQLAWGPGWDWELYGPIVSWAAGQGIPLKAANLDKGELKTVRAQPVQLGRVLLGEEGLDIHRQQFKTSHCGVPHPHQEVMLRVQVARDARMAASLLSASEGSVLLTGNWHARKDIGVPLYVLARQPDARIVTLGMMERPADGRDLSDRYDIVWWTEGMQRPDYCTMFRNAIRKQKAQNTSQ